MFIQTRRTFTKPMRRISKKWFQSRVWSVMGSLPAFVGEPCLGSFFLSSFVTKVRDSGDILFSDCWAIKDFYDEGMHEADDPTEAAALGVTAGTDLNYGVSLSLPIQRQPLPAQQQAAARLAEQVQLAD